MLKGKCHCGNIRYDLEWPEPLAVLPARRCSCTYCKRFDGAWTRHPQATLAIRAENSDCMSRYRFGTGTADFIFCRGCGVTLFAVCEIQERLKAVLNVHTLESPCAENTAAEFSLDWQSSCFDNETLEQRLERRGERWIGNVSMQQVSGLA